MAFTPFVESDQPTMANFNEKFQECIQEAIEGGTEIFTGSYVGTGTYGADNPNTLTFPFTPKAWSVYAYWLGESSNWLLGTELQGRYLIPWVEGKTFFSSGGGRPVTMQNKIASWYGQNAGEQLNDSGMTFYYIAIGKGESA